VGIIISSQTFASSSSIPAWIKNTARWWADGQINDDDYIKSIQWLIDNKILRIPQSNNLQTQQLTSDETKANQSILDTLDSCTKITDDVKLKLCIDYAKKIKELCDRDINEKFQACKDPRLEDLSQQPAMSPFSNTVCRHGEFGTVEMSGQFTNDGTPYSFISLKLGVLDSNGDVVATGVGIISNIEAFETKIFDASALYSGSFSTCKIQVESKLP